MDGVVAAVERTGWNFWLHQAVGVGGGTAPVEAGTEFCGGGGGGRLENEDAEGGGGGAEGSGGGGSPG